jgi:Zn-dependent metalloprotease
MKTKITFSFLLFTLFCLGVVAQKSNPIIQSGTTTVINNSNTPKQNVNRPVVKPAKFATTGKVQNSEFKINGSSFFVSLENVSVENAIDFVKDNFKLSNEHSFVKTREVTDELAITHYTYVQYYKGIKANEGMILLHGKNGLISSANGQVSAFENLSITPAITKERAKELSINFVNAKEYLKTDYEIETVIVKSRTDEKYLLTYKVRIDASVPLDMSEIFIDAQTGKIISKISLIAHSDALGTAQTYYSGSQTITADSYNGSYRLRETGRKIETYNATNGTFTPNVGFTAGYTDITDNDNNWTGTPYLSTFTVSNISSSWWYAIFADENADLYIVLKNGSNQTVFTSSYFNNTNPPVTFAVNVLLTNPPYTVELWDYDAGNANDYGGSYTISTNTGTQNWSGSGNNGSYVINAINNPSLDVHWGMEKTYDFYSNVFGRNSYDGNGSIIKNYINPPFTGQVPGWPNQAFALQSPYNIMCYGMGDGNQWGPVVGLDVEGHEYTHLVTANNGNGGLQMQGESGALNESFSDIFGTCIEFYSNVSPDWTIGEGVVLQSPFYLRSMSNPNAAGQPDTYDSPLQNGYWAEPNCGPPTPQNDQCGVHRNSGVQNFWFYLLCQGGSGTNDIGNAYTVSGIGITQARQIAYRTLMTFTTPNATFWDSYITSLQAAADLYGGVGSAQWNAVSNAWYAVGIGNGTNNNTTYCNGTTYLYASSGTFADGSGNLNYLDNGDCIWSIQPAGANTVTITFPQFNTEAGYDSVMVYDGPDENYPVLMTWWGTTLPPAITSTNGALTVRFMSDISIQASGWLANYTSTGVAYCDGGNLLTTPTGSFNDGSSGNNYGNNQFCYWYIAPPCASSVTLSFSQFNTELNYDGIIVYDGSDLNAPQLLNTSGTNIPASVTSSGGEMLVLFISDFSNRMQGFAASYTSIGSAYCSGVTNLTTDWGLLSDGSGNNNYCNNMGCNWLIQPTGATTVTLNFTDFDLEPASQDGLSIYDAVEVYDGSNTSATLLGRFTGSNLPSAITSSGSSMYVKFYSDQAVTATGWSAFYTSTTINYCTGLTTLTAPSGTFVDGSGGNLYGNNADCQWLIQPPNATSITMGFTAFDTETNYDGVIVYDGNNTNAAILNQFTGASLPATTTSTGGSMLVQFLSDVSVRQNGWNAYYNSSITVGVDEFDENVLQIFPNPNSGTFTIQTNFDKPENALIRIYNTLGETVKEIQTSNNRVDVKLETASGVYFVELRVNETVIRKRLVLQ